MILIDILLPTKLFELRDAILFKITDQVKCFYTSIYVDEQ